MALSPKQSAQFIANIAKHVSISKEGIETTANMVMKAFIDKTFSIKTYKSHPLHPKDPLLPSTVDWIFLIDTLNFSFWSEPDQYYKVTYHNETNTGYWSLCAAINRAIEEGYDIASPKYYSSVTLETLQHIFRSDDQVEIPLLKERHRILNETGKCLLEKFEGSFVKCIDLCKNSSQSLLKLVIDNFPSYRDEATFENNKVAFYKRAQILIGDIWTCFEGQGYGLFNDIDSLTIFADYRIPQLLVYLKVLNYSDELEKALEKGDPIENGHRYEVEIRGCTIWAVEQMSQYIKKKQREGEMPGSIEVNAVLIDYFLWDYRREYATDMEHIPIHKTRCIYY